MPVVCFAPPSAGHVLDREFFLPSAHMVCSETCTPLYPPHVVYLQLLSDTKSRVNACASPGGAVERCVFLDGCLAVMCLLVEEESCGASLASLQHMTGSSCNVAFSSRLTTHLPLRCTGGTLLCTCLGCSRPCAGARAARYAQEHGRLLLLLLLLLHVSMMRTSPRTHHQWPAFAMHN